jgi:hypothetical protein
MTRIISKRRWRIGTLQRARTVRHFGGNEILQLWQEEHTFDARATLSSQRE